MKYDVYKYLSNDQTLKDIIFFAINFYSLNHDDVSLIENKIS